MDKMIKDAILRIESMEELFDELSARFDSVGSDILNDERYREKLDILTEYYEGGIWMADYELDESGLLPCDLKRGILSEDGFYNFLFELEESKID